MVHSEISTPKNIEPKINIILLLLPLIFSPIVTMYDPLTSLLSTYTINIVCYSELMKLSVLDRILTPSPSPDLLISPTNNTDHVKMLLELEANLNAPPLLYGEKLVVMTSFLAVRDDINLLLTRHQFIIT